MTVKGGKGACLGKGLGIAACLLMLCVSPSCQKPPAERIIQAEKVIEEARAIKAPLYASVPYGKAAKALQQARHFVKTGEYREAANYASLAILYAQESVSLTPAGREELLNRTAAALERISQELGALRSHVGATKNKRRLKNMESILGPFAAKWDLELQSLRKVLETEEPYESFTVVDERRRLFEKELAVMGTSLRKAR